MLLPESIGVCMPSLSMYFQGFVVQITIFFFGSLFCPDMNAGMFVIM